MVFMEIKSHVRKTVVRAVRAAVPKLQHMEHFQPGEGSGR